MKKALLIALVLVMTGCSTKFTYNNLTWLAYWYLDDYVELTSEQKKVIDQKLYDWQLWHRYQELPKYQAHLKQLQQDVAEQTLTMARLEYHHQQISEHWQRLKQKVVPELVALAPMLSKEQVEQLFAELAKRNAEKRDELLKELAKSPQKQKEQALDELTSDLNDWLGSLNVAQEQLASRALDDYLDNRMLWLDYRSGYQAALKTQLLELIQAPDQQKQLRLAEDLLTPEGYRSEQLKTRHQANVLKYRQFLLSMNNLLSQTQRQHLVNEINEYNEEIAALLRE
ncbi:DUF6279 family lipoprotein [Motilimonas sp. 1_MG-2023]|uniref:DUF6279 family lipoprotein n=1 Tax=Motilimonas sp. 1_MG-2023 TaxID=3062672 RepID=UPI0026E43AD7|nr:DUF6279 family lipoprotein [Motilimonas sp. 1_MG-2023]MDO6524537.1 DUF6279 family lipoprotein [Motilimonas sp. 1_MG-2023]